MYEDSNRGIFSLVEGDQDTASQGQSKLRECQKRCQKDLRFIGFRAQGSEPGLNKPNPNLFKAKDDGNAAKSRSPILRIGLFGFYRAQNS